MKVKQQPAPSEHKSRVSAEQTLKDKLEQIHKKVSRPSRTYAEFFEDIKGHVFERDPNFCELTFVDDLIAPD